MKRMSSLAAVFFLAAIAAGAQTGLSGVWKNGDGRNYRSYTIRQQGSTIQIDEDSRFSAGTLSGGTTGSLAAYTADGVERAGGDAENGSWTTALWDGPSLIVLRVTKKGYRVAFSRAVWTVSPDGNTLTIARRNVDMDGVTERTETYRRQ